MKKVINVGIGGRSFVIDEDAYQQLEKYLDKFRDKIGMGIQTKDVMEDLEQRIAELFSESLKSEQEVVNLSLVNKVISQLGMPDGSPVEEDFTSCVSGTPNSVVTKRLYRDPDSRVIGGVCSGLAYYLNVDVVLVRVLFCIAFMLGGVGFWGYIIFWIVTPLANTASKKCEMRGLSVTAENLRKFSIYK
ncbi:MAG TPA: PspC domain-containing protein [Bacteroidales bacterium]|nr:PspC domain-containing protein [Bacteroidales bacterium]